MENNTVLLGKLLILSVLTAAASFIMMILSTNLYVAMIPMVIFGLLILFLFRKPIRSLKPLKGIWLLFIASFAAMLFTSIIAVVFPLEGMSNSGNVSPYLFNLFRLAGVGIAMAAVLEIIIYFSGNRNTVAGHSAATA